MHDDIEAMRAELSEIKTALNRRRHFEHDSVLAIVVGAVLVVMTLTVGAGMKSCDVDGNKTKIEIARIEATKPATPAPVTK